MIGVFVITHKLVKVKCINDVTLGVNFIKVLRAALARADPESIRRYGNLTKFLCFWELRA